MTSPTATPARFILVGLLCAGLHNAIMILADHARVHYALASLLSYGVVVVVGFALHVHVTFRQHGSLAAFWRYAVAMAANYPLTLVLLFLMCGVAGWRMLIAAPAATVLLFVWNYTTSRWAIVRAGSVLGAAVRRSS